MKRKLIFCAFLWILTAGLGSLRADSVQIPAIGKIIKFRSAKGMLEIGDKVTVVFKKKHAGRAGAQFAVYRIQPDLINSGSDIDDDGRVELMLGVLEIEKMVSAKRGIGRVVSVLAEIQEGDLLKKVEAGSGQ